MLTFPGVAVSEITNFESAALSPLISVLEFERDIATKSPAIAPDDREKMTVRIRVFIRFIIHLLCEG
jgi:hypothetical protein